MTCVCLLRYLQMFRNNLCMRWCVHSTLDITGAGWGRGCGLRNEEFVIYTSQGNKWAWNVACMRPNIRTTRRLSHGGTSVLHTVRILPTTSGKLQNL
jgi:hypothetical protein